MLDDKQFLISDKALAHEGWKYMSLYNGKTLSYSSKLNVTANADASVVILGYAWQAMPSRRPPSEIIESMPADVLLTQLYEIEKTWCGRYIFIYHDLLLLDMCGMLGVFYSAEGVSSSIRVLSMSMGVAVDYPPIKYGQSPNFVPGPLTTNERISKLLPSQILNYVDNVVTLRPLLPDGISAFTSEEQRISSFVDAIVFSLQNMQAQFSNHKIYLALTGGVDSRILMSLMEKSGIDYKTFTAWHSNISEGDKDIPAFLAKRVGRSYQMILRGEDNQSARDALLIHSAGYAVDQDVNFWSYG